MNSKRVNKNLSCYGYVPAEFDEVIFETGAAGLWKTSIFEEVVTRDEGVSKTLASAKPLIRSGGGLPRRTRERVMRTGRDTRREAKIFIRFITIKP